MTMETSDGKLGGLDESLYGSAVDNRTSIPSQSDHVAILVKNLVRRDLAKKKYWFIRTFGVAFMMMMYTIGFMVGYDSEKGKGGSGKLLLNDGENWDLPESIILGSSDQSLLSQVQIRLQKNISDTSVSALTNITEFKTRIYDIDIPSDRAALFLQNNQSYTIYYNSDKDITQGSFRKWLAGTQHLVNGALLDISGTPIVPIYQVQEIPEIQYTSKPSWAISFGPGALIAMACALMMMFTFLPIVQENLKEVVRAYLLIGVHLRSYLFSWVIFLSANGLLTAGIMTLISFVFRLYSRSNMGLVYVSHYLMLVHMYCICALLAQFVKQEELANGIPWMCVLLSIAVGALAFATELPDVVLGILTGISPFFGIIHYSSVYGNYDYQGYGTGVHPSDIVSSGLIASYIGQLCGIMFWISAIVFYSRQTTKVGTNSGDVNMGLIQSRDKAISGSPHVEPLSNNANVLLSVKRLFKSFNKTTCFKHQKTVDVLKGLDMTICRDEVFGFLGHNGAGKTTCIKLMSGELQSDSGDICFNFKSGSTVDVATIRKHIGVCPQHNLLLNDGDTCREVLTLYASLKGNITKRAGQSDKDAINDEVQRRIDEVKFTSSGDADKPLKTFSGGMKRKVSIAIACLGSPEAIFLDEPTAGMDPYNRRQVWDMILKAKKGRSIILTTHFMEEADVLSDRVCIINRGKVVTCGSTLFLKHHFGAGYRLNYQLPKCINVKKSIPAAESVETEGINEQEWCLPHGSEKNFPAILNELSSSGATDVSLKLATLEEVFLATGREDYDETDESPDASVTIEPLISSETLSRIWNPPTAVKKLTFLRKIKVVQSYMLRNAAKQSGSIAVNIVMPLIYLVGGFIAVSFINNTEAVIKTPNDVVVSPQLVDTPMRLFGFSDLAGRSIDPLLPVPTLQNVSSYFNETVSVFGGYYAQNQTLQHNDKASAYALQVSEMIYSNYEFWKNGFEGVNVSISQLPYKDSGFRIDIIILPIVISFGVVGLVLSVLDVLLLKSSNIFNLFRVAGVSDWQSYLGIATYKCITTYVPFMIVIIILGNAFQSVLFGNGGRWLGTVLLLLGYAFAVTPLGLLFSFLLKSNFESAKNWFPGLYMTGMSAPYAGWSIALQLVGDDSKNPIRVVGDFLSLFPPFAFQRGLGGVIDSSPTYNDSNLLWSDVWNWQNRVWFTLLLMIIVGTFEWFLLRNLSYFRPSRTKLSDEEIADGAIQPIDTSSSPDISLERSRSMKQSSGINARDLVKTFKVESKEQKGKITLKRAVKGISFGIKENEIFVLLGPNGAGKTVTTSMLTGEYTPDYGEIVLDNRIAKSEDRVINHLYDGCAISSCPQFDSLFLNLSVLDHMKFYSQLRGLDLSSEDTLNHIESIMSILGLTRYENTMAKNLSGGYKRRLSLAIAMVGYPKAMIIDEVTTGMDPAARHLVWSALKPGLLKGEGNYDLPAILLSTHYMDEAAKLGTRIGIMIDGEMITTGTLSSLTDKFCNSYFLEVSLEDVSDVNSPREKALSVFRENNMHPETYEHVAHHYKIQIPFSVNCNPTEQLADIFTVIENNKTRLSIKYYSVSQMSLEQIFIDLSKKQFEK